jgi:hypothetical protein
VHLVLDSDVRDRLRDLVDLDGLLRHFGSDAAFFDALLARAGELGLAQQLALATHFCVGWLGTPVPAAARRRLVQWEPRGLQRLWLLPTLGALLAPTDPDRPPPWTRGVAAALFLGRYHAGRLPLRLLLPHLLHKLHGRGPASPTRDPA